MKTAKEKENIPPIRPGANSYKPEDIRKWGIKRFMEEVAPDEPFAIPDLGFTDDENRRMDEILKEEQKSKSQ